MPESKDIPRPSSGSSAPPATFPLRVPSLGALENESSVISDEHTAISIHAWIRSDPTLGDLTDDPVAFECDYRPHTAHPTRSERTTQVSTFVPSPVVESPRKAVTSSFPTLPQDLSPVVESPRKTVKGSFPTVPQEHVTSTPHVDLDSLRQVTLVPLHHVTVEAFSQARDNPSPHTHVTPLPEAKIEVIPQQSAVRPSQAKTEPLEPLKVEALPQVHVKPIVSASLDLQQVNLGSSQKSSARSSGTYPRLVVETPRSSSVRTSRDAAVAEKRRSSARQSSSSPEYGTAQTKWELGGACGSFAYGTVLGLIPVLLVARVGVDYFRRGEGKTAWDERWLKYGCTFGLFLIVGIAIIVVIVNIS